MTFQFACRKLQRSKDLARISHNAIEKSSLFWYNLLKTRKLTKRQGASYENTL